MITKFFVTNFFVIENRRMVVMTSMLVVILIVAVIAALARWLAYSSNNSDFGERYTKYQEKSDELSRTLMLTYVCCKRHGCRHLNEKGKCTRRSIVVDQEGNCKDCQV